MAPILGTLRYHLTILYFLFTVLCDIIGICGDLDNSYICQDGSGLNCIDKDRRCDETQDCSDGSDEKPFLSDEYCLALTGM